MGSQLQCRVWAMSVLFAGHGWRGSHFDPGAVSPNGWNEAWLVREVALSVLHHWEDANKQDLRVGFPNLPAPLLLSTGSYTGRCKQIPLGSSLVLQLHADAVAAEVGPDRTTCWYWPQNKRTANIAAVLCRELQDVVPWPVKVQEASAEVEWHKNARACLGMMRNPSILLELGYTDGAMGREALPKLVSALGKGIALVLRGCS